MYDNLNVCGSKYWTYEQGNNKSSQRFMQVFSQDLNSCCQADVNLHLEFLMIQTYLENYDKLKYCTDSTLSNMQDNIEAYKETDIMYRNSIWQNHTRNLKYIIRFTTIHFEEKYKKRGCSKAVLTNCESHPDQTASLIASISCHSAQETWASQRKSIMNTVYNTPFSAHREFSCAENETQRAVCHRIGWWFPQKSCCKVAFYAQRCASH